MLPKSMMDCVREAVCDKGWPDHDARIVMKKELEEFNKKIYEPIIKPEIYITTAQYPDSFIETVYKRELGKITTDCKGCTRLTTPNDPECKNCYKQNHYKAKEDKFMIDLGFEVDIKKEMEWLSAFRAGVFEPKTVKELNPNQIRMYEEVIGEAFASKIDENVVKYVLNDVETTTNIYETLKEREEKDMANAKQKKTYPAVLWNPEYRRYEKVGIKEVIFNDPATIVMWNDGVKTVVKCQDEVFDPEKGLAMAITKRFFGNEGNYCDKFKKHLPGIITKKCKGCARLDKESDLKCRTCVYQKHYVTKEELEREERKEKKIILNCNEDPENKHCSECEYEKVKGYQEPCMNCIGSSKWEPKKGE